MEAHNFVSQFHNLSGDTIGEKRKNLFLLLKNVHAEHDALDTFITPKNHLETLFKLDVLLQLQMFPQLLQTLKDEDELHAAIILKNKWFCQKLASVADENSVNLVRDVFPCTSYVIRMRMMNKLARYGTKLDLLYDDVCTKYGSHFAVYLLVGCSAQKIEHILTNRNVILTDQHVILLHRKHPQLLHLYLNKQYCNSFVAHAIAIKDLARFLEIAQNFNIIASLGRRLTKKLAKRFKNIIIANASKLYKHMHTKTLVKVLSASDFRQFFFNLFPTSLDSISYDLRLISKFLGNDYYKLLSEAVKIKYGSEIYSHSELVTYDMIRNMEMKERDRWIEIKKKNGAGENAFLPLMKTGEAFLLVKEKINVTSDIYKRCELLELLVDNCKENNDLDALAELGGYVCFHHRNDDEVVLSRFLQRVRRKFQLQLLEERHWQSIESIIKIITMKGNEFYNEYEVMTARLEFLHRHNKLDDPHICKFLRLEKKKSRWSLNELPRDLRKFIILKSVDLMPCVVDDEELIEVYDLTTIESILQYNKDFPTDFISIYQFPRLVESLDKIIDAAKKSDSSNNLYNLPDTLKRIICSKEESNHRNKLISDYFALEPQYYELAIDFWLLKYQPDAVSKNFEQFLKHTFHPYCLQKDFAGYLKKYDHFSFPDKTVKYCLDKLSSDEYNTEKIFKFLAVLMPTDRFLKVLTAFRPTSHKIDENEENNENKWQLHKAIIRSLKFASFAALPTLLDYCKGDFLGVCLESLYYLFYHSPENKLSPFIEQISTKSVSLRKHSIFLTCKLGEVGEVHKIVKYFNENEKNVSIQKHLFTAAWKYFTNNPSDEIWDCVKCSFTKLNEHDEESFGRLVKVGEIPGEFQVRYIYSVWGILCKSQVLQERFQPQLLSAIPQSTYGGLSLDFLLEIISNHFLLAEPKSRSAADFVASCLAQSPHKLQVMDAVFQKIKTYKEINYTDHDKEKNARSLLYSFVNNLITKLKRNDHETLRIFSERWHQVFSPTDSIKEHIKILLALSYWEANQDVDKFCVAVRQHFDRLLSVYGIVVVDVFAAELRNSLCEFLKCRSNENEDYFKYLNGLKDWQKFEMNLLLFKLLPINEPLEIKAKTLYFELLQGLRRVPQEPLQMLMNVQVQND